MALLKAMPKTKRVVIRHRLGEDLIAEIDRYCVWAGLADTTEFLAQAAVYVLAKDKEWQAHKTQIPAGDLTDTRTPR